MYPIVIGEAPLETRTVRQPALGSCDSAAIASCAPAAQCTCAAAVSARAESRERTRIITQVEGVLVQVEGEQVLVEGAFTEGTHEGQVQNLVPGFATGCPEGGGPRTGGLYDGHQRAQG